MKENIMKISVITICYNEPKLEKTCLSVINQTYQDFEWIVIDGGSAEKTQQIFNKYKSRINTFISEPDMGIYNAMNKGINLSKGEYLIFLNAGDSFFSNDVLETVISQKLDKDIVYGNLFIENKKDSFIQSYPRKVNMLFLINNSLPHQASFIKSELFNKYGNYNEEYKIVSDWEKWIIFIILNHCSYKHINTTIALFNLDGISSKNSSLCQKERQQVLDQYFNAEQQDYYKKYAYIYYSFVQKIFSIKSDYSKKYKIITILGIHFYLKKRKK